MRLVRLAVIPLLLASIFAIALTLTGPTWTPLSAYTNDTLSCTWSNSTDALAQNITLMLNGAYFNSSYENATSQTLRSQITVPAENTTRGDIWTCRITLYNDTSSTSRDINVTILNSPPVVDGASAGIFNSSGDDIGYLVQMDEDTTLAIDVNATDADGDTITYLPGDEFCTRTSSTLGTYTCSVTQSQITNNSPTTTNITFTVTDGQNVGGRTVLFNITPVNDAPVASLVNQSTPVNVSLNYTFTVTDEESNTPYVFTLAAPGEISDKIALTSLNAAGSQASITYTPGVADYNDVGIWRINVTIMDNSTMSNGSVNNASGDYFFYLNISAAGRHPFFRGILPNGTYTIAEDSPFQINITANDPDPNSTITFVVGSSRFNISTINPYTNTTDASAQINFTPTNNDVGVFNVTLSIIDQETLTNTTTLQFNVTNVNDAPEVSEISPHASNSLSNTNASNLTAYANSPFVYYVNGTDIDIPYGDSLIYTDNTSLFTINATTGLINFTPVSGEIGMYHINISVMDTSNVTANRTIILTINANSPPYFNSTIPQLNCTTKSLCTFPLSSYTDDVDVGDAVALYTLAFTNSSITNFSYNATSGLISFTTIKTDIGVYTLNATITDSYGATNSTLFNISISNTPEAPNLTRFNFSNNTLVETYFFSYELQAVDDDFSISDLNETVNFTTNMSIAHTITPLSTSNTTARALLTFTPDLGAGGNYTIMINATDSNGLVGSRNLTFQIYGKIPDPNITNITPWGDSNFDYTIQTSFASTSASQFSDRVARVSLSENTTVRFNITVNSTRPLTYDWQVNGTSVGTSTNYTRAFDFFSSGRYIVTVNVTDDRLGSAFWTWNLSVANVNRAPVLHTALQTPLLVNGTTTYSNYFLLSNGTKFLDPDDDLNSDGTLNGAETNSLNFTATECDVATLSASSGDLRVEGVDVGSCIVTFNATDTESLTTMSGNVTINITEVDEGETQSVTTVSSGGGGGSSSVSTLVPLEKKLDNPKAFNLITPRLVTIYNNKSVAIPITINNTWTTAIKELHLTATSNETTVQTSFDVDYFEEIPVNESREVTLTVTNYRFGDNYEVLVEGNLTSPKYKDSALILLNSIQQSGDGEDFRVKVTFANDLVTEHPECQELNEVLTQAKKDFSDGNIAQGTFLVESVIAGCKYLVSTQQKIQEKPSRINPVINIDDLSLKNIMLGVLAFVLLSSIAFIIYYHYTHKAEDDI